MRPHSLGPLIVQWAWMHPVLGLCPLEWYHDGQGLTDHCCVLRQAAQHKATSGGADSSVCRICVDFHLSTLSLESDMPDTNCWEKKPKKTLLQLAPGVQRMMKRTISVQTLWAVNPWGEIRVRWKVLHTESMIASNYYSISGYFQIC